MGNLLHHEAAVREETKEFIVIHRGRIPVLAVVKLRAAIECGLEVGLAEKGWFHGKNFWGE
jgi:chloramphenicol 3-O-phosphotransferase